MATTPIGAQVAQAFNRFGFGGRPDDIIPTDVNAWLAAQLTGIDPLAGAAPTLTTCLGWANAVLTAPPNTPQYTAAKNSLNTSFANEITSFLGNAITTKNPFRERLVWFWANHFAIQANTPSPTATAGAFVREAIRPYVLGNYSDMLLAVMQHPAMLTSLNNDVSVGPQSPIAIQQGFGNINENLGRETLELFTVGIGANYTQADVDSLAYILTGWTVSYTGQSAGFVIDSSMHQPGPQTLMGVTYPGTVFDGYQALLNLGTNPLTYAHIAGELVTHFTSDTPDPNDVASVTAALTGSGGNLTAAANAIIALPNAWVALTKLRSPANMVVATARACAATSGSASKLPSDMSNLGEPVWQPPFPNGWSDIGADWAGPAAMMLRVNWLNGYVSRYSALDPVATGDIALGALLNPATTAAMGQVTSSHDKLQTLFSSPEFQRR